MVLRGGSQGLLPDWPFCLILIGRTSRLSCCLGRWSLSRDPDLGKGLRLTHPGNSVPGWYFQEIVDGHDDPGQSQRPFFSISPSSQQTRDYLKRVPRPPQTVRAWSPAMNRCAAMRTRSLLHFLVAWGLLRGEAAAGPRGGRGLPDSLRLHALLIAAQDQQDDLCAHLLEHGANTHLVDEDRWALCALQPRMGTTTLPICSWTKRPVVPRGPWCPEARVVPRSMRGWAHSTWLHRTTLRMWPGFWSPIKLTPTCERLRARLPSPRGRLLWPRQPGQGAQPIGQSWMSGREPKRPLHLTVEKGKVRATQHLLESGRPLMPSTRATAHCRSQCQASTFSARCCSGMGPAWSGRPSRAGRPASSSFTRAT